MPDLKIHLDGDACWPDLQAMKFEHAVLEGVALLEGGMQSGAPSVGLRIKTDDGRTVIAETSFQLFEAAARAFRGRVDAMTGDESWTPSKIGTPTTKEEYEQRFAENAHASGFGFENLKQHMPCPFCAAPEWLVVKLLELEARSSEPTICKECGRGAKTIYTHEPGGVTRFEIVQTRGDDAPPWLPKIRRVDGR
jgi:hypothetical protein